MQRLCNLSHCYVNEQSAQLSNYCVDCLLSDSTRWLTSNSGPLRPSGFRRDVDEICNLLGHYAA